MPLPRLTDAAGDEGAAVFTVRVALPALGSDRSCMLAERRIMPRPSPSPSLPQLTPRGVPPLSEVDGGAMNASPPLLDTLLSRPPDADVIVLMTETCRAQPEEEDCGGGRPVSSEAPRVRGISCGFAAAPSARRREGVEAASGSGCTAACGTALGSWSRTVGVAAAVGGGVVAIAAAAASSSSGR